MQYQVFPSMITTDLKSLQGLYNYLSMLSDTVFAS